MGWGEEKKYFDIIGVNAIYGLKIEKKCNDLLYGEMCCTINSKAKLNIHSFFGAARFQILRFKRCSFCNLHIFSDFCPYYGNVK